MTATAPAPPGRKIQEVGRSVTIRFAGDSGDGMQLAGTQFTDTSAIVGNDISTLPDFPAEIRAPAGTLAGVSGFQIHFSSHGHLHARRRAQRAGRDEPRRAARPTSRTSKTAASSSSTRTRSPPTTSRRPATRPTRSKTARSRATALDHGADRQAQPRSGRRVQACRRSDADRCKNFFALGLVYWLYERPLDADAEVDQATSSARSPPSLEANTLALKAGYNYGETDRSCCRCSTRSPRPSSRPARYRKITGNEAVAMGLVAAAQLAEHAARLLPATRSRPASDILHQLAEHEELRRA